MIGPGSCSGRGRFGSQPGLRRLLLHGLLPSDGQPAHVCSPTSHLWAMTVGKATDSIFSFSNPNPHCCLTIQA
jgi:hypothetical protein